MTVDSRTMHDAFRKVTAPLLKNQCHREKRASLDLPIFLIDGPTSPVCALRKIIKKSTTF